jgi:hypothetical protein
VIRMCPSCGAQQGDIPKYTDIEPIIQNSDVKISRELWMRQDSRRPLRKLSHRMIVESWQWTGFLVLGHGSVMKDRTFTPTFTVE